MATDRVDILVVDDLPEKLLVYETILVGLDHNVHMARSGREALRLLLEREYAVILLDVNMPDMDGFETAAMIRARRQSAHTPIIFVTALADEMNTAQAYSLGAVDYILTPVIPEVLRAKVAVFAELYKKTQQVKRHAAEHVALARAQAAHDAAIESNRRLAFLSEASTVLVRSLDYEAAPRALADQAIPFLGEFCAVTLIGERDSCDWRTELAWIDKKSGARNHRFVQGLDQLGPLAKLIETVMETGQAEMFLDIEQPSPQGDGPLHRGPSDAQQKSGLGIDLQCAIVAPLQARGSALGTVALAMASPDRCFGPDDFNVALDLAGRAAIAIDNARLYRDVQENNRRKNEFLAMLAHELRNPLAPVRNAVEILTRLNLKNETLSWATEVIARQLEHLVRLVDDLLDISRISGGKIQLRKERLDAATAVARAVETSRPLIDARHHELTLTLPPEPVSVNADPVRLAQVLANLLNNAAKYTEEGGKISVDLARLGDQAVFRVCDNGIGIPREKLLSIFELFTQVDQSLDRSHGGLGVGLNLVRRLVEKHGGTVEALSEGAHRGSEFVIRIPAIPQAATEVIDARASPSAQGTGELSRRRILVVDDYPLAAESLMKMLQLGGHDVRVARDGPQALEEVQTRTPDVVVLDIGLPGMDGYEVAKRIRNLPSMQHLMLIALSGYGQDEDRRRSSEAGFNHHLTKPVDTKTLYQLIAPPRSARTHEHCDPCANGDGGP
jgi:signal transduction histidine kinase/DNA-binding response OmpR family regulator